MFLAYSSIFLWLSFDVFRFAPAFACCEEILKALSQWAKTKAESEISFDVCRLFSDLFRFRLHCRGISHTPITIKPEAILKANNHSH